VRGMGIFLKEKTGAAPDGAAPARIRTDIPFYVPTWIQPAAAMAAGVAPGKPAITALLPVSM